jgi:hypothetical protein
MVRVLKADHVRVLTVPQSSIERLPLGFGALRFCLAIGWVAFVKSHSKRFLGNRDNFRPFRAVWPPGLAVIAKRKIQRVQKELDALAKPRAAGLSHEDFTDAAAWSDKG